MEVALYQVSTLYTLLFIVRSSHCSNTWYHTAHKKTLSLTFSRQLSNSDFSTFPGRPYVVRSPRTYLAWLGLWL